jgi:hypothetical protein
MVIREPFITVSVANCEGRREKREGHEKKGKREKKGKAKGEERREKRDWEAAREKECNELLCLLISPSQ